MHADTANIEKLYSIKVDNIAYTTSNDTLWRYYAKYAPVRDVHIPRERGTKRSLGFAFIRFVSLRDALRAKRYTDNTRIDGRRVRVELAVNERRKVRSTSPASNRHVSESTLHKIPLCLVCKRKIIEEESSRDKARRTSHSDGADSPSSNSLSNHSDVTSPSSDRS